MTRRDLASIGVRLMSVFAVLLSVQSFATGVSSVVGLVTRGSGFGAARQTDWLGLTLLFLPPCVMLFCAAVLWWAGNAVGHFVAGGNAWREEPQGFRLSATDGVSLLLSAIGLYLIVIGIMPLLTTIGFSLLNMSASRAGNGFVGSPSSTIFWPQILSQMSSLVAGSVMVFGARRIATWLPAVQAIEARHASQAQMQQARTQNEAIETIPMPTDTTFPKDATYHSS